MCVEVCMNRSCLTEKKINRNTAKRREKINRNRLNAARKINFIVEEKEEKKSFTRYEIQLNFYLRIEIGFSNSFRFFF